MIKADAYTSQILEDTWSYSKYDDYKDAKSTWTWEHLPFGEPRTNKRMWLQAPSQTSGSILEIGSAAAGAYDYMKESGLIDLSDYTGLEISRVGHEYSKNKHPSANWVQADVTQYEPDRSYDYVFERIAVHHMPDPLSIIAKFLRVTNKAFCAQFVSCLNGDTISDLSVARYRHSNGDYVFFDIINVFEVIEILYQHGFNRVSLRHSRLHEKVYHDPLQHQYVSPDVDWNRRMVARCMVFATKEETDNNLSIYPTFSRRLQLNRRAISLIKERIRRMCGERDGVLYESEYFPVK